ncbi:hypothetical protein [Aquabacterium humicola]|uniref:hypothetical protein n=1 Tax=Aquabacterium humicola TaxID=3237377 RepID=UPI002543F355|nr:hypothetical protein [Rubrivivax pictus]
MHQAELLANWARQKTSCNYQCLVGPVEVEFEFKGQFGHPSSYAYVRLRAEPADELAFSASVAWPEEFDQEYARRIQDTVAEAIVDGLLGRENEYPYRGCSVQLIGFRWDSVGGSERAVHRATVKAVELLRANASWHLSTGHYRSYRDDA